MVAALDLPTRGAADPGAGDHETDRRLLALLAQGLPLVPRPYAALARRLAITEDQVLARTAAMLDDGTISRFGVIVRHRALGYLANAMVVWDLPDGEVRGAGRRLAALPFVTLCYRRPRRLPLWPYNLFTMIHGRDRAAVEGLVDEAARRCALEQAPRAVLFSRRCFTQRGARHAPAAAEP